MVHYAKEFYAKQGKTDGKFEYLKNKFTYNAKDTADTIASNIEAILDIFRIGAPKFIITPSYYVKEDGSFESASFTIRPSSKADCTVATLKRTFNVYAGQNLYSIFVDNLADWTNLYHDVNFMYENIADLQEAFDEVIAKENIPFSVKLDVGEGIVDLSDNSITVGLSEETVMTIVKLPLYNTVVGEAREVYKAELANTLKACAKPMDLVKQNTKITKELGIFSRKSIVKLIRKRVTRKIEFTRVGEGYIDTPEYFAVISKVLMTDTEAAELLAKNPDAFVIDNTNSTSAEQKAGKSKIYVSYKVSPFNDNRETLDIDIKTIAGVLSANEGR